jgi:nicotinamide-nucleotide adenylyltransferase
VPEPAGGPPVFGTVAMIARWKPVHRGHAAVLTGLAAASERAVIGIGSSNRYDLRNPFTAEETADMIRAVVGGAANVTLVAVPDLDDGPRWRAMVVEMLGPLDAFFTANAYVRSLLRADYRVLHPAGLVPPEERVKLDATAVRRAMARGDHWHALVPEAVAALLEERGLIARFRHQFGAATLALDAGPG